MPGCCGKKFWFFVLCSVLRGRRLGRSRGGWMVCTGVQVWISLSRGFLELFPGGLRLTCVHCAVTSPDAALWCLWSPTACNEQVRVPPGSFCFSDLKSFFWTKKAFWKCRQLHLFTYLFAQEKELLWENFYVSLYYLFTQVWLSVMAWGEYSPTITNALQEMQGRSSVSLLAPVALLRLPSSFMLCANCIAGVLGAVNKIICKSHCETGQISLHGAPSSCS